MRNHLTCTSIVMLIFIGSANSQQAPSIDESTVDGAVKAAFPGAPPDWKSRLVPDDTMKQCSASGNAPTQEVFKEIQERERATIQYPQDGKFLGDWKKGEALAQLGYGMRFTDYPPARANGGNCYGCHQITKAEVSFGTIGPSLQEYGKLKDFKEEEGKAVYEKIYNPHSTFPCSLMPRLGANKVLTIEQIKDLVALLMDPASPVNNGR